MCILWNNDINTGVKEVVQEGLDKCFLSLSDYLGMVIQFKQFIQLFVFYDSFEVQNDTYYYCVICNIRSQSRQFEI